ncbi:hypothetical protein BGZ91_008892 [Linnemannia elongata]|nr:hypothetical protein BGZ91_008892 [Linnemannia elongata]
MEKQAEVVLLSDEDDMKDPKTVKRKKHSQEVDSRSNGAHTAESKPAASSKSERNSTSIKPELQSTKLGLPSTKSGLLATSPATPPTKPNAAPVKTTPTSTKYTQPPVKPATSSAKPASSATLPSSSTVKPAPPSTPPTSPPTKQMFSLFTSPASPSSPESSPSPTKIHSPATPSLSEKSEQLGIGSFPHLPLEKVRVGTRIDIKRQKMVVQLGPDRFIINIDKNATKIPHHTIRVVGYYVGGETKLIVLSTSEKLDPESILAPYYDPSPQSGKGKRLVLYTMSEKPNIEEYCDRLASKGCSTHKLTSESAAKYLEELNVRSPVEPSSAGTNAVVPHIPGNPGDIQPRQTLFLFPFKSTAKTRSIAVHIEDLARLFESDFLNDILIEFGLKYIYEGLEKRNPELAKRTYIFNSFFYQRLIDKPAAGMSAYDAVKSWTNKIDLFAMDFIVVPICEKAHWYLAIITYPGLLLKEDSDDQSWTNSNESSIAASPMPSPARDSTSGSPAGSPVLTSVTESMDSLAGSTKDLLRIKGEHGIDQDAPDKTESATGRPKRIPRSIVPPPKQHNMSDCGLYLLHFAEVFLKSPHKLLDAIVNNKPEVEQYWKADELPNKREYYRDVVMQLAEDYKVYLAEQKAPNVASQPKALSDKAGK